MNNSTTATALLVAGAIAIATSACATETDPTPPETSEAADDPGANVNVQVDTGRVDPKMIYIDRYGACVDIPGTNMFTCCMPGLGKCFNGYYD